VKVVVNGRTLEVAEGCTVTRLLETIQVTPSQVAVERNQDIVPKKSYDACALAEGDQIEVVTFVGGG
jgi:sulfur carrier protein